MLMHGVSRRWRLFLAVALAFSVDAGWAATPVVDFKNPPQGVLFDEWYAVTLAGAQCGYMHSITRRDGDFIVSDSDLSITVQREKFKISIGMKQQFRETVAGEPVSFDQSLNMAGQPVRQRGRVKDGKLKITTEQFGFKQKKTFDFDPEIRFPWGQQIEMQKHGLKPGTTYELKTYEPTMSPAKPLATKIEVLDWETIVLLKKKVKALKVRNTVDLSGLGGTGGAANQAMVAPGAAAAGGLGTKMVSDGWVDAEGFPMVIEMSLGSISVRILRSDKQAALRLDELPELFFSTFVKTDQTIDRRAEQIRLRLSVSDGEMPDIPDTGMQKATRVDARTVDLTIRRADWERLKASSTGKSAAAMEEYLATSPFLDTGDELIVGLAKEGRGKAKTPWEIAANLRVFVTDYITKKDLGVGFATASEVAKTKQGDCTEHGVLLAALARVNGLPSRVVAGLIQVPGRKDEFGYHMWTEVWIEGRWVDIDAAMDQTECDATHIALTTSSLSDGAMAGDTMAVATLLGRLKIEKLVKKEEAGSPR